MLYYREDERLMDIVIISEFCEDFSKSDNDRFFYLAKMLAGVIEDDIMVKNSNKYSVELITSSFRHTSKKHRRKVNEQIPFKLTFVEEPGYKKNVCLKRFYSHYMWGKNVKKYLNKRKKPDIIYCAVPSLTTPYFTAKYCEKNMIKFIIDVQDLWPEAFQMVFNIPVISTIVFTPFRFMANSIYKRADVICAVSDTYCKRAASVNRKVSKTNTVFLGTDLATFDRYSSEKPILRKKADEIWLAYCGTLGNSYDLTCAIDALVNINNPLIKFIVMGDGPKKNEFEEYAKSKNANVIFVGRLQYNQMCSLLSSCDITINPIVHGAAASIINKHADYAACGLPTVNTQENSEYRDLINKYHMGFNCKNNNVEDLSEKIEILINDEKLREEMGKNARQCAIEKFDRKRTYVKLVNSILGRMKL